MGFDEETEEVLRKWTFTDAAAEYIQLQDRIERAIEVRKLGEKIVPAAYVIWATNSNIPLPNELTRAVKARSDLSRPGHPRHAHPVGRAKRHEGFG
jgi:hypothetical protein